MLDKSFTSQIKSGVLATAAAKYSNYALSLVTSAILARLLTPDEFGIVAVVTVIVAFFQLLGDIGLGPAVIQYSELEKKDLSSLFTLSLLLGSILSALFLFSAPIIAEFYDNPLYYDIVPVLSGVLGIYVIIVVPRAVLMRQRRFAAVGIITVISNVSGGIGGIICAMSDLGAMSLAYKSLIASFLNFFLLFIFAKIPFSFRLSKRTYSLVFRYSSFQFLFQFINYFSRNLDNLLIGKFLGKAELGYYEKSYRLMMLPLQTLTYVISPVLHPVLSQVKDDKKRIYSGFLTVTRVLALMGFPLCVFLSFAAREVVLVIFGMQWEQSVPVFRIMALSVGFQMVLSSTGGIFQAAGKTEHLFISGVLSAIVLIGGIIFGVVIGSTETIAVILVFAFAVNFLQGTFILSVITLHNNYLTFLRTLIVPLISAGAVLLGNIAADYLIPYNEITIYLSLAIKSAVTILSFGCAVIVTGEYKRIRNLLKK